MLCYDVCVSDNTVRKRETKSGRWENITCTMAKVIITSWFRDRVLLLLIACWYISPQYRVQNTKYRVLTLTTHNLCMRTVNIN